MLRTKDFNLMDVIHISGNKIGFVNDIIIDLSQKEVLGFSISSYSLFQKSQNILKKDILSFNDFIIVSRTTDKKYLLFKEIKNMDVIDKHGNIIGMMEDIIFEPDKFIIKGFLISTGVLNNYINGKKIALINDIVVGEESILYIQNSDKINFTSIPHKITMEDDFYEKKYKDETN